MANLSPLRWIVRQEPFQIKKPSEAESGVPGYYVPVPYSNRSGYFLEGYNIFTMEMEKRYGPFQLGLIPETSFGGASDLMKFAKKMNIDLEATLP